MILHAIEQRLLRGQRRDDGVGRLKFDSTQITTELGARVRIAFPYDSSIVWPKKWTCWSPQASATFCSAPGPRFWQHSWRQSTSGRRRDSVSMTASNLVQRCTL